MEPGQATPQQQAQHVKTPGSPTPQQDRNLRPPGDLGEPGLVVVSGPYEGRRIAVPPGGITLGRDDQLGPPFTTDETVSRRHAMFRRRDDESVEVADLSSANGTYINGHQVAAATRLNANDLLRIGQIELRLDVAPSADSSNPVTVVTATGEPSALAPSSQQRAGAHVSSAAALVLKQIRPASSSLWELAADRLTIGRDPSSDIVVADSGVSRHHADLVRHGPGWLVIDAGSANGTRLNGATVRQGTLQPGDRIEIGNTEFTLWRPATDPPDRTAAAARFDVGAQAGNISNVAGDQANYYQESSLRFIASRRGRARRLMVIGLIAFLLGNLTSLPFFFEIIHQMDLPINSGFSGVPRGLIDAMVVAVLGSFVALLGVVLFIFGIIARNSAKREAINSGVGWK